MEIVYLFPIRPIEDNSPEKNNAKFSQDKKTEGQFLENHFIKLHILGNNIFKLKASRPDASADTIYFLFLNSAL